MKNRLYIARHCSPVQTLDSSLPLQPRATVSTQHMALRVLLVMTILLCCIALAEVSSDTKIEGQQTQVVKGTNRRLLPFFDCGGLCKVRCGLHSRPNMCIRACGTCCARCKCVPPGTSGNREMCGRCYMDMTTHGNRTKCP